MNHAVRKFSVRRLQTDEKIIIGVGRFRILGGGGWGGVGGKGGPNSKQAHDVVTTSMRRNDVASTSFRRHVLIRFLINTFLILKSDIIENSRTELRGIVLPTPSNQIKVTFIISLLGAVGWCDGAG